MFSGIVKLLGVMYCYFYDFVNILIMLLYNELDCYNRKLISSEDFVILVS